MFVYLKSGWGEYNNYCVKFPFNKWSIFDIFCISWSGGSWEGGNFNNNNNNNFFQISAAARGWKFWISYLSLVLLRDVEKETHKQQVLWEKWTSSGHLSIQSFIADCCEHLLYLLGVCYFQLFFQVQTYEQKIFFKIVAFVDAAASAAAINMISYHWRWHKYC